MTEYNKLKQVANITPEVPQPKYLAKKILNGILMTIDIIDVINWTWILPTPLIKFE